MRLLPIAVSVLALGAAACSGEPTTEKTVSVTSETMADVQAAMPRAPLGASASVALADGEGASAGTAGLRQGSRGLVIRVEATGLTPGWHGIHLHAVGSCEGPAFDSAGGHVHNAEAELVHGFLNAESNDAGDLPNVYADADGRVNAEIFTPFARLADSGPGDPLLDADGSALLIHANPDDYESQPIGGAGDRVACGVITSG